MNPLPRSHRGNPIGKPGSDNDSSRVVTAESGIPKKLVNLPVSEKRSYSKYLAEENSEGFDRGPNRSHETRSWLSVETDQETCLNIINSLRSAPNIADSAELLRTLADGEPNKSGLVLCGQGRSDALYALATAAGDPAQTAETRAVVKELRAKAETRLDLGCPRPGDRELTMAAHWLEPWLADSRSARHLAAFPAERASHVSQVGPKIYWHQREEVLTLAESSGSVAAEQATRFLREHDIPMTVGGASSWSGRAMQFNAQSLTPKNAAIDLAHEGQHAVDTDAGARLWRSDPDPRRCRTEKEFVDLRAAYEARATVKEVAVLIEFKGPAVRSGNDALDSMIAAYGTGGPAASEKVAKEQILLGKWEREPGRPYKAEYQRDWKACQRALTTEKKVGF